MHLSVSVLFFFFFNDTATTEIYTLSLHDALPISSGIFEGPIEGNESYAALNQALAAANAAYATAAKARAAAEEAQVAVKEQLAAQGAISAGLNARLHALESEQAARETELAELRVSAEARQRALDAVTKAELDSNATIADMRRENTSLTERIRRDNEQIQQLRATIDALHRSWSWRLTSPVRLVTTLLRRMRPTAIRPFRRSRTFARSVRTRIFRPARTLNSRLPRVGAHFGKVLRL